MSSTQDTELARLQQLLEEAKLLVQQANERVEQERERADQERQRAEQERTRAEQEQQIRQDAESRADIEGQKTRPTTFEQYIRACHTLLSKPLRIQTDKSLSTQGSITSSKNKRCPTLLKPWADFSARQQELFDNISHCMPADEQLFSSTQYLRELGQDLCDRPLASEKDLEPYQRLAVERPTTTIISKLQQVEGASRVLGLSGSIIFENHANTLSDNNEEVLQSLQNLRLSSRAQASSSNTKPRNADQICVYRDANGVRSLCMLKEYKPAHKLSVFNLRAGLLRADSGSMNVPKDVINRITIPQDPADKFVYHSERLVAAALMQTYSYMIENGLEYSQLATGEADVFLRVLEDEPHTLYYHLAEPRFEAEADSEVDILLCRTAVSQTLTFCLMAMSSKPRSQLWRNHTMETASKAVIEHESVLRQIPVEEKALTPPSSVFNARIYPVNRSPIKLRPRKSRHGRSSCGSIPVHKDATDPSSSSDELPDAETPSKPSSHARQSGKKQATGNTVQSDEQTNTRQRSYCTQACLLGLIRRHLLDEACPNVDAHRIYGTGSYHSLNKKSFVSLISSQLARDPDNGCEPLGKQGARGALFKLTLKSHGYTFVAKGTVLAFKERLKHEVLVYKHLSDVQGKLVPVYLGNFSLVSTYFLDVGVRIVYMLLMSWAGEQANSELMLAMGRDLEVDTSRAVTKMLDCGVEHRDVRPPNVLWNPETRNVVLVDFERSEILKRKLVLQELSPNQKRNYLHSLNGVSKEKLATPNTELSKKIGHEVIRFKGSLQKPPRN